MCCNSYEQLIESKTSLNGENNEHCLNQYSVANNSGDDHDGYIPGNHSKNLPITGKTWLFSSVRPGVS